MLQKIVMLKYRTKIATSIRKRSNHDQTFERTNHTFANYSMKVRSISQHLVSEFKEEMLPQC